MEISSFQNCCDFKRDKQMKIETSRIKTNEIFNYHDQNNENEHGLKVEEF